MKDFFNKKETQNFKFLKTEPERWNFLKNSNFNGKDKNNLLKLMEQKNLDKAIPGGKYGCALMLKKHYREEFKDYSLGKLVSFIKESLKTQVYVHFKTLILPN